MDIAASVVTQVLKERQVILESQVSAAIQALKERLDTQEFQDLVVKAVTVVNQDTQEEVGIAGLLGIVDIMEYLDIQVTKVFQDIRDRKGSVDILVSLDSLE